MLAALAAHMTPPYTLPELIDEKIPGYSKLEVGVIPGQPNATYYVQLPPEYNPLRRYPMIVSLHGIGHDPTMQIDWWAGDISPGRPPARPGGRYGYIVIAPEWTASIRRNTSTRPASMPWCWAAPRRLPAVRRRYRSRVSLRLFDGRRRGLGHRRLASRSLGGRDSHFGRSPARPATSTPKTPGTCRSMSCWASWTAAASAATPWTWTAI